MTSGASQFRYHFFPISEHIHFLRPETHTYTHMMIWFTIVIFFSLFMVSVQRSLAFTFHLFSIHYRYVIHTDFCLFIQRVNDDECLRLKDKTYLHSRQETSKINNPLFHHLTIATPGGPPTRSRPSSKMTKYVECWGADKPFANITDSKMAKNIGLAVSISILSFPVILSSSQPKCAC